MQFLDTPPEMHLCAELRGQKRGYQLLRQRFPDNLSADAQQVDIVVFDTLVCGIDIMADSGANTRRFVTGDGRAHTRATYQQTAFRIPAADLVRHQPGYIGEIDGVCAVCAMIRDSVAPRLAATPPAALLAGIRHGRPQLRVS